MDNAKSITNSDCVSIIIPVYNSESNLNDCLESIVNQSYTNIEVVLVDDGSTDSSLDICLRWAESDKRVKVISQNNAGPSAARNIGYIHSTGGWVWFVDSDDRIGKTSIEILINRAIKTDTDVAVCDFKVINGSRVQGRDFLGMRSFPGSGRVNQKRFLSDILSRSVGNYIWQFLIKRSVLDSMGPRGPFDETLILYEDVVFSLRLAAAASRFSYVDDVSYYYRMTEDSLVHRTDPSLARQALRAVDYVEEMPVQDSLITSKLESCLILLFGAGKTAGMGEDSKEVRSEIKARVMSLMKDKYFLKISTKTKLKCVALKLNLYWTLVNLKRIIR